MSANDIPSSLSHLTALQQLDVSRATATALSGLQAVTGLTKLRVRELKGLSEKLQLPALQHLELSTRWFAVVPSLAGCPQLDVVKLSGFYLSAASSTGGSLFASTMLQQLELHSFGVSAADGAAGPVSWQQVFPGAGLLPHLTLLKLMNPQPGLQHADMECLVACCSSLQVLGMVQDTLPDNFASALACLSGLTSLSLYEARDEECSSLAQLTGLRELRVHNASDVSTAGLQQLATLAQLTCLHFVNSHLPSFIQASRLLWEQLSDELSSELCAIINKVCGQREGFTAPQSPGPLVL